MVDDADIVCQQGDLGEDVAGDQDRFPALMAGVRMKARISAMPIGSKPLMGSSRISRSGSCMTARAMARRCFMPREYCGIELFVFIGQFYQSQGVPDRAGIR